MTDLTLFHTAEIHRHTFDSLARKIAPDAHLSHVVRPDWLERARIGLDRELRAEIADAVSSTDPALCTCTTIGEIAEEAGAIRIDWPMMKKAAELRKPVLLVYCLESTRLPSKALLRRAFDECQSTPLIEELPLTDLWDLFAKGSTAEFDREIAFRVEDALTVTPNISSEVLAQASMSGAAAIIRTDIQVLASPELALRAALGVPNR